MLVRTLAWLFVVKNLVVADVNLHNPRGSNNRHDEPNRDRRNANRLFNSENNSRGGHNVGKFSGSMYYYAGSKLKIEWANQHSCGYENNNCQVILQYMCDENLRDGTTTSTAPVTCTDDCDTNALFGHHESLNHYEACFLRERNRGLFTADKNLVNGLRAVFTRQHNRGSQVRYGYECPEERDYYPYFGDSPWKDIAIMTNDEEICKLAQTHSQNVKSRWICTFSDDDWDALRGKVFARPILSLRGPVLALDKESCERASLTFGGVEYQAIWKEIPSHNIPAPECIKEQFSRDNHQGNTIGGEFMSYTWTVPEREVGLCAVRIRYNISSNDFSAWTTDHTRNTNINLREYGPEEIYDGFGFQGFDGDFLEELRRREYYYKTNPIVDVFNLHAQKKKFALKLALDTTQFGRTFQDRSHAFGIKARPEGLTGEIHNLNVRGKRGNIVQVYPSTEYDFVPTVLHTATKDFVHIQWTGSDNNDRNNAGQGKAGTDRSNIVQLGPRPYHEGKLGSLLTLGTNYPKEVPCEQDLFGLDIKSLGRLALAGNYTVGNTPGETLDDGDAYFDFGLLPTKTVGKHYYFSTRNNAFTNRDQKASLITAP